MKQSKKIIKLTVEEIEQALQQAYGVGKVSFTLSLKHKPAPDFRDPPRVSPILRGASIRLSTENDK